MLADAGWDVMVLEAQPEVGGAVRSGEVTAPGFVTDLFSAFYPLAAASPLIRDLDLDRHGLEWVQAPAVLAHQLDDGRAAVLHRDAGRTAAALDEFATGDGEAWLELFAQWRRVREPASSTHCSRRSRRSPPVRGCCGVLKAGRCPAAGPDGCDPGAPAGRGDVPRRRADGCCSPATRCTPTSRRTRAGSGMFGWLLAMLGQDVGFPVPRGGAGRLAHALRAPCGVAGGAGPHRRAGASRCWCGRGARTASACATARVITARRAILADVPAPALYSDLLGNVPAARPAAARCRASSTGTTPPSS